MSTDIPSRGSGRLVNGPAVLRRLAAVEAKLARPRSLLDKVKDWAGVGTLLVALLYTFPSSVLERITDPARASARELGELRVQLDRINGIMLESMTPLALTTRSDQLDAIMRLRNNRLYLTVSANAEKLIRRRADFLQVEQVMIGLSFLSIGDFGNATTFLEEAMAGGEEAIAAEAARSLASFLFSPSPRRDQTRARMIFRESLARLARSDSYYTKNVLITSAANWAFLEATMGDWTCGQALFAAARRHATESSFMLNDGGNLLRMIEDQESALQPKPGQKANGCDGHVAFLMSATVSGMTEMTGISASVDNDR